MLAPRANIDTLVHVGFAVLMFTALIRYVLRHDPVENLWIMVLAGVVCALYLVTAFLVNRKYKQAPWVIVLVATSSVLVLLAPSFAWCSFGLFFLCRRTLRGLAGYLAGGLTVLAAALSWFMFSDDRDIVMLLGPIAIGAMLTLIFDRMEQDAAEQRRLNEEISSAQLQLAASERRAGIITERARVSREIHDTVTQGLASSLLLLEAANRNWPTTSSQDEVRQASELLRHNLMETRRLVHDLASPATDTGPLPEVLREAASAYLPDLQMHVVGTERPVSPEVRHALLRVVQSAAANVKLHSGAEQATVTIGFLQDTVTLDIHDNGRGFTPEKLQAPSQSGGYGLRAMRQRVEQLGGEFSVESTPRSGTIIAALIPSEENNS
ncbi:histidine kinase [Arthrobacter sp. JUb115]|uniref:sensor histidine kinase n=1 Tax=Arthrobacter sp. JUb115 TaxID=2485108 RepID=UPI00105CE4D8|nr:histidine kinase [Arthrobacter sp. JUb115]TDU21722.1 signal transduction histidine kinase [Arthrobacter sp. JUb115]